MAEIELHKEVATAPRHAGPPADHERDVMVAAAGIALQDEMKEKLMGARLLIEARDMKIQECELASETERQRTAIYQDERDRAVAERCKAEADLKATEQLYGNLFGMLERFRLPTDIRRKSNGTANGNSRHRVDGAVVDDEANFRLRHS